MEGSDGIIFVDNVVVTRKNDGVILPGRNLGFMKSISKVVVKFPTFVKKIQKKELKGCSTLDRAAGVWRTVIG